jgi:hypothetical protein
MCHAVMYTCDTGACIPTAQIVQANLAQIGIEVEIQVLPRAAPQPRGKPKTVPVRLSRRAMRALKRVKRLKTQAVVTLTQSTGKKTVKRATITLRAPRPR